MRTIHYNIRLALVLIFVALFYWSLASLLHQAQVSMLVILLFTVYVSERLFALLQWVGPVIGTVDMKEQEKVQKHLIEHELSRASRSDSSLVIGAIREGKRTSSHVIKQNLRSTDIVLRSQSGYLLVLMPDTTFEQARSAFKRLTNIVAIRDVVLMDQRMLQMAQARWQGKSKLGHFTPQNLRRISIEAINAKFASITPPENEVSEPVIYTLFDENVVESHDESSQSIQLSLV